MAQEGSSFLLWAGRSLPRERRLGPGGAKVERPPGRWPVEFDGRGRGDWYALGGYSQRVGVDSDGPTWIVGNKLGSMRHPEGLSRRAMMCDPGAPRPLSRCSHEARTTDNLFMMHPAGQYIADRTLLFTTMRCVVQHEPESCFAEEPTCMCISYAFRAWLRHNGRCPRRHLLLGAPENRRLPILTTRPSCI